MIQFENVTKHYGDVAVLDKISFTVEPGQFAVLIGPSGCGKTTTLKTINRLIEPDGGRVLIDGDDTAVINRVQLRRRIGYVIQQIGLFPNMTVAQNITVVPKLLKYDKERCDKIVHEMLEMVDKYPTEMSGGQQQRIGVLRALAASPPIVLMDEPFGALDPMTRSSLQDEIIRLQKKLHKTIVFVTHDMEEALSLADVIIFMEDGHITQMAPPEEMLKNPANETVKNFLGKHIAAADPSSLTAADFMKTNVVTVDSKKGLRASTALMMRSSVDSLIVTDENDRYIGTLSVEDIKSCGSDDCKVVDLLKNERETFRTTDDAKRCFDMLLSTKANYVIVLNPDDTVAGIITKTSIAKALAERLWG
jgi:osmoprotectant transport system ATP-binding protein